MLAQEQVSVLRPRGDVPSQHADQQGKGSFFLVNFLKLFFL